MIRFPSIYYILKFEINKDDNILHVRHHIFLTITSRLSRALHVVDKFARVIDVVNRWRT